MDRPCDECIVLSMCNVACENFRLFLKYNGLAFNLADLTDDFANYLRRYPDALNEDNWWIKRTKYVHKHDGFEGRYWWRK